MSQTKDKKNILQIILKLLSLIVIAFVCVITFFLLYYIVTSQIHSKDENYRPGISIYTIVSPSMTPVINVYDVVVNVRPSGPEAVQIGDIITYKSKAANSEGMTITHRVVAIDKTQDGKIEYMTQGDNNSEPDGLFVTFDQVIGKEIMIVPKVGKLQFLIANKKGWLLLLIIPIGIYLLKELFKLINLFGLRNKVVKVINEPQPQTIKSNKTEIEERKEHIRENLRNIEIEKTAVIKPEIEPESFLEQYSETKLEVKTNKYKELKAKKEADKAKEVITPVIEEKITEIKTPAKADVKDVKEIKKEEIELPKIKEKVNDEYEILDTDELSSKIKEYDTKLLQLNKMISDIENLKNGKEEPKKDSFIEVDDFLKGGKIKVKKIEETKNQKRKVTSKRVTEPSKYVQEVKIELNPIVNTSSYNPRTKIARPEGEDISQLRSIEAPKKGTPKKVKKSLNLNPKEVNKIKTSRPNNNKTKDGKKRLSLNPRTIQKVTKEGKTVGRPASAKMGVFTQPKVEKITTPIKQPTKATKRKREPFIIIKKVK